MYWMRGARELFPIFCEWEPLRLRGSEWPVEAYGAVLIWKLLFEPGPSGSKCSFYCISTQKSSIVFIVGRWKSERFQLSLPGVSPLPTLPTSSLPFRICWELLQGAFPGLGSLFSTITIPVLISVPVLNNSTCYRSLGVPLVPDTKLRARSLAVTPERLLVTLPFRWGNWSSEGSSNLHKVTQLINHRMTPGCWAHHLIHNWHPSRCQIFLPNFELL